MNSTKYLTTDDQLSDYLLSLKERQIKIVAVDLEGEYNLHHYGEHLCLVQIFDGEYSLLIDPQTIGISLIKDFFENPDYQKIFYDCTGDRTLLFRKYGINPNSIVDLLPAVELLEFEKKGLSKVLTEVLGLEEKNKKKFQRYNWMRRPIQEDALVYAIEDVNFLFDLKDKLMESLQKKGLMEEYDRINQEVQSRPISLEFVPGLFKKNRFKKMSRESQELFRKLFAVRNVYAEKMDLPPNSVVSNENLYQLSCRQMNPGQIIFSRQVRRESIPSIRDDVKQVLS
ncbi:MAG: hypothetical protein B6241_03450 [Spirochaetaceae bacterium 4572_59]|nr:MAG: hypothetical protein B6241_03450 [Spirochaetaceae bacterium 4572_59]